MTENQVRQMVREQIFRRLQKKLEIYRESVGNKNFETVDVITESELRKIARQKIKEKLVKESLDLDL